MIDGLSNSVASLRYGTGKYNHATFMGVQSNEF